MQNSQHPYGGPFWRFLAFFIDSALIGSVGAGIDLIIGFSDSGPSTPLSGQMGLITYFKMIAHLCYGPLFESSSWQATPGKRMCRLYVADLEGKRISFGRALIRNTAKVLSVLTLGFGFLMIAVTVRNQCLHDKIAGTVVLKRK